ncbi:MAG TPA: ABC transporter permease [Actinomycetota bacterium]|nr:ABC transporter permease [Actinomycetota bacterium]
MVGHSVSSRRITWAIASRSLMLIPRVLSTFIPSLVMPVFLTIAMAGAFSGLVLLPAFPAEKALDWFIPMTTVQGAAFAGITTGMGLARDLDSGFYDRLLLSPATRGALLAGPIVASVLRATIPLTLLVVIAVVSGATFHAGAATVVTLALASFGIALVAGAWSVGLALRFKTQQVAPLMQTGVFLAIFLSTAQMPLEYLTGWLHAVARVNPMTNVLALAREGFLGEITWDGTWPGLVSLAAMAALTLLFAARQMRRVIP